MPRISEYAPLRSNTLPDITANDLLGPLNLGLTPASLLEELNQVFPERSPDHDETIEDLMWRGGQRDVVRWIESRLNEEQNSV